MRITLFLLVLASSMFVSNASAQERRRPPISSDRVRVESQPKVQPANSIWMAIRYKAEYGYKYERGLFDPGPNSCSAFHITARFEAFDRRQEPILITNEAKMRNADGYYYCDYRISDLPLNEEIRLFVGMADSRVIPFETWIGGSQPVPPPGHRRAIPEGKTIYVRLSDQEPRRWMVFTMIYYLPPSQYSVP